MSYADYFKKLQEEIEEIDEAEKKRRQESSLRDEAEKRERTLINLSTLNMDKFKKCINLSPSDQREVDGLFERCYQANKKPTILDAIRVTDLYEYEGADCDKSYHINLFFECLESSRM